MSGRTGRIWLLIRSLDRGGAERQLVLLARALKERGFMPAVVVFYGGGAFEPELTACGISIHSLRKRGRWDVRPVWTLWRLLRRSRPEVIYSFLVHGNLTSLVARVMSPNVRVIWGLRGSRRDLTQYGLFELSIRGLQRMFARLPDATIVNSLVGRDFYLTQGFPAQRLVMIPNGIDTDAFVRDEDLGAAVRRSWGIVDSTPLLGLVGRLEPDKGQARFLWAASKAVEHVPTLKFVCIGREGRYGYGETLRRIAAESGIADRVVWAGERSDMQAVYSAIDGLVVASETEGFPNVIAEAMSCGTPCVARSVGDSAEVMGETGVTLLLDSDDDLARAMVDLVRRIEDDASALRAAVRDRIVRHFSRETFVTRTLAVLYPVDDQRRLGDEPQMPPRGTMGSV